MAISRIDKLVREVRRTDSLREASEFRGVDVDIFVALDDPAKGIQMALTSVALSLRCLAGEIRVHLPQLITGIGIEGLAGLRELLYKEAQTYGQPERLSFVTSTNAGAWKMGLGRPVEGGFLADAEGWHASVNQLCATGCRCAAPAAVFATCCAFAKLFGAAVLREGAFSAEAWSMSLATGAGNSCSSAAAYDDLHLGRIGLVGAGAIGSGFAYTLCLSSWSADLDIIDRDFYDTPNHETTMFLGPQEACRNRKKAVALADLSRRQGLNTMAVVTDIKADHPILLASRDAFVCAVDNPETRRVLDNVNASILVNAGLGGRREDVGHLVLTRHLSNEQTLSHRYSRPPSSNVADPTPPPAEFADDCGRIAYRDVALAAPFMGVAAGALMAAQCAFRAVGHFPPASYFKMDMLRLQSRFQIENSVRSTSKDNASIRP